MHRTIKLEEAVAAIHARLAQALVEHHSHIVAVYGFVRDSLTGLPSAERQSAVIEHVKLLDTSADWLEMLEPGVDPHVRRALNLYLEEVAKVAQVVRMRTPYMDTDEARLNASLEAVLELLESYPGARDGVDKRHSDTTV